MKFKPFEEIFEIPLKNGLAKPKRIRGEGFKMVNMGELFSHSRMINIPMDRVPLTEKEKESFTLEAGDLLFARQSLVREGAGQCSIFLEDNEKVCFESHLIRCRLDKEKANPLFYYYYFRSRAGKLAIDAIVEQGAGAAGIRGSDLKKLIVPDVDKAFQDVVANKIDSIDQKIEINRQINQTLESVAQTIFKSWFVNFEPVKAKIAAIEAGKDAEGVTRAAMRAISGKTDDELDKMEGGQPEDYAQLKTTAELFPAAMQDSELGGVPEGWEIKQLDHIAHYQNGLPLQKFRPENDERYLLVLKIAQLNKGFADGEEKASANIKPECIVDNGDVVFSWSGSLMVDIWCGGKVALNQHLFKVTSEKYPKWFYYYWTKHYLSEFQRIASAKAVTMGHIKREHLSSALCATPSLQILGNVSKTIECLVEKSIEVRLENFMLQNLRDTLLPKLLSGELSVDAIEMAMGE